MAITFPKDKKSKYYLILLLIIIFLICLIIVWRIFFAKPTRVLPPRAFKSPEIKINFETLKNPLLKEFQPFEEIKPFEEKAGRENPFSPY